MLKYPPRNATSLALGETPRPVFGIDIDGTLGSYHSHFVKFAEGYLGRELPTWHEYRGQSMASFLKMSKETYREIKLAYRRGGLKRSMPCYPGAAELTAGLRRRGGLVVVCTTRPFLQLDNVEADTHHWLKRHGIQYDAVLSGEHKYRNLAAQYGPAQVVSVLEDLPALVDQAEAVGLVCNIKDTCYNRDRLAKHPAWRVFTLGDASVIMNEQLDAWEAQRV